MVQSAKVTVLLAGTARKTVRSLFCYPNGWLPGTQGGAKVEFSVEKGPKGLKPQMLWLLPKQKILQNFKTEPAYPTCFFYLCRAFPFSQELLYHRCRTPKLKRKKLSPCTLNSLPSYKATLHFQERNGNGCFKA
jgi:hypothetical protein